MAKRDVLVIGGSAGSIEAITEVVRGLPADSPAAVFLVVHFPGSVRSVLPRILSRAGSRACRPGLSPRRKALGPGDVVRGAIRLMEESSGGRG